MKSSKDIFIDQRIRETIEDKRLQRLGQEGYLTIRKARILEAERTKVKKK